MLAFWRPMFAPLQSWFYRGLIVVGWASGLVAATAEAGARTLADLPERARELTVTAVARVDALWDERAALLTTADGTLHGVRPTAWYAFGLLVRDAPGDRARAARAIDAVLQQQIHAPGWAWHGTFYQRAQEQRPMRGARMWEDYDPNWRQFIGCTLAQALIHYADRLPEALQIRMIEAIVTALEGEAGGRTSTSGLHQHRADAGVFIGLCRGADGAAGVDGRGGSLGGGNPRGVSASREF